MDDKLYNKIQKIRFVLEDNPDGPVIGKLRGGKALNLKRLENGVTEYYSFLVISNGARCGAIDIFSYETMLESQYYLEFLDEGQYDVREWVYVGQCLYDPIILNKISGLVYQFYEGTPLEEGECYGPFNVFLNEYVFGEKYETIIPDVDDDKWYQLLKEL